MFQVYLRVVSERLDPEQVTRATGIPADEIKRSGEPLPFSPRVRAFHSWIKHIVYAEEERRVEDAESILIGWGSEVSRKLGELHAAGDVDVSLVIVQKIDDPDDRTQQGIPLSAEVVAWLAEARASIDIDQYILID